MELARRKLISWRSNLPKRISMRCGRCGASSTPKGGAIRTNSFPAQRGASISRPGSRSRHESLLQGEGLLGMTYEPSRLEDLASDLARANAAGEHGVTFDLRNFKRILEHIPEDMTVTVEAGLGLATLQEELSKRGQWLPIDPPN